MFAMARALYPAHCMIQNSKENRMTVSRRWFNSALAAALLSLPAALAFAAPQPWDDKVFQAAQSAGKPVLVDIYASW